MYGLGHVCIVACKPGLGGAAMPSKTWSIMSSGRAVLANFDEEELKEIVEGGPSTGPSTSSGTDSGTSTLWCVHQSRRSGGLCGCYRRVIAASRKVCRDGQERTAVYLGEPDARGGDEEVCGGD